MFPIWKKKAIRENTDRGQKVAGAPISGLGSPENPQAGMPALRRGFRNVEWHNLCSIEICRFLAYILLSGAALEPSTPPSIDSCISGQPARLWWQRTRTGWMTKYERGMGDDQEN